MPSFPNKVNYQWILSKAFSSNDYQSRTWDSMLENSTNTIFDYWPKLTLMTYNDLRANTINI